MTSARGLPARARNLLPRTGSHNYLNQLSLTNYNWTWLTEDSIHIASGPDPKEDTSAPIVASAIVAPGTDCKENAVLPLLIRQVTACTSQYIYLMVFF
jgi:hypothetical protein